MSVKALCIGATTVIALAVLSGMQPESVRTLGTHETAGLFGGDPGMCIGQDSRCLPQAALQAACSNYATKADCDNKSHQYTEAPDKSCVRPVPGQTCEPGSQSMEHVCLLQMICYWNSNTGKCVEGAPGTQPAALFKVRDQYLETVGCHGGDPVDP